MPMIIEINPNNLPTQKTDFHFFVDSTGLLAQWALACPKDESLKSYMLKEYVHPCEMPPGVSLDADLNWCYSSEGESDEPLPVLVSFTRINGDQEESIYIYKYAFVAFIETGKPPFFARMD